MSPTLTRVIDVIVLLLEMFVWLCHQQVTWSQVGGVT